MKIACVDPITNGGNCASVCYFEDGLFSSHQIVDSIDVVEADKLLCYDALKIFSRYHNKSYFEDVKTLYGLHSIREENLILLSRRILGLDESSRYEHLSERVNAHLRSYKVAKINVNKFNLFQMLPEQLISDLYKERSMIMMKLYEKIKSKVELFEYYKSFYKTLRDLSTISSLPVKIDLMSIKEETSHFAETIRKNTKDGQTFLKFNPVGAKTGRLTCLRGSVSPYTLPKSLRKALVAPPGYKLVQGDFKSFQPRLAIFSTDDEEFKNKFANIEDIYSVFPGDREENKISFLAWMFSLRRHDVFDNVAAPILRLREQLLDSARRDGYLINSFGRPLYYHEEEKNVLLQNYITSLEVDSVMTLVNYLNFALKKRKSRIIFPFHDAVVFYIHEDEKNIIPVIQGYMESHLQSKFGSRFPVEMKWGDNFLDMGEIDAN